LAAPTKKPVRQKERGLLVPAAVPLQPSNIRRNYIQVVERQYTEQASIDLQNTMKKRNRSNAAKENVGSDNVEVVKPKKRSSQVLLKWGEEHVAGTRTWRQAQSAIPDSGRGSA